MHFNSVTGGNECSVFCLKASGKKRVYASIMSLVELGKRLLDAAKRGDTDEVRSLMSNGAPFTTDWLGMSPLHFAARNGHIQTAEVLLRAGISRDARTKVDRTPLHVASQEGHLTLVELLLQNSADIEARDMLRMTPLHWATEKGHVAIIELLLKNGADATCEDKFDRTTLDIANGNDRTDLIQMLQFGQQQQNSDITGITEGETVTVETTETVTTTSNDLQEIVTTSTSQTPTTPSAPIIITKGNASPTQILPVTVIPSKSPENSSDPSSTSVLATLAVLAEATAPFNAQNPSTAEAMSWLESHGITMISTNDGSIITSAMESGQSIALTEAGKMALNIIKQQGLNRTTSDGETQDSAVDSAIENVVGDTGEQKVITIVTTDQNQVTSSGSDNSVLVAVSADVVTDSSIETERDSEEPLAKKSRLDSGDGDQDVTAGVVDLTQILHTKESRDGLDKDELRRQLEEVQRQADAYKLQLRQKELEAEVYKKQLSEITTNKLDMK